MKRFSLLLSCAAAALVVLLSGCEQEEVKTVPTLTGATIASSAVYGEAVPFSVTVSDQNPVQSVTATLLSAGKEVARSRVTESVDGTFSGTLQMPYTKNLTEGNLDVMFLAINSVSGHSEVTQQISCSYPAYVKVVLVATDGTEYELKSSQADPYNFEIIGDFPKSLSGYFRAETADGLVHTFGGTSTADLTFGSTASMFLFEGEMESVPNVTLGFNTKTLETIIPLLPVTISLPSDGNSVTKQLTKDQPIYFEGLPESCWIDVDFFVKGDGCYYFNAVAGSYKITREDKNGYIRVERMNGSDFAKYDPDNGVVDAIWAIGNFYYGKPTGHDYSGKTATDWDTNEGYCLAEVEDNIFQISFHAVNMWGSKFFWQKGWGGEFKLPNFASYDMLNHFVLTSSGDIRQYYTGLQDAVEIYGDEGYIFRVTLDVSGGKDAVKLSTEVLTKEQFGL